MVGDGGVDQQAIRPRRGDAHLRSADHQSGTRRVGGAAKNAGKGAGPTKAARASVSIVSNPRAAEIAGGGGGDERAMKKLFEIALGIVTSFGGFLEAGSIATAAQAGAVYQYQLLWAVALGTIVLIFLIEMAGRLAAVGHHPLPSAVRERFGFNFYVIPLIADRKSVV